MNLLTNKIIYDVSVSLSSKTPVFPGQPRFKRELLAEIAKGGRANLSHISLTTHTGTHVDSPFHFIKDGITIDQVGFNNIIGFARLFELNVPEKIDLADVRDLEIKNGDIVLFKTRNSELWDTEDFVRDYVYITAEVAGYLAEKQVRAVGVDYIIPEAFDDIARPVHHLLLGKNIILIEGLNFTNVPAGEYQLICLPLKIAAGDAAPARAVLVAV
jgi:arylformamidase